MFQWFASSLASKFRLTDNKFQLVGSKLSWRRNYDSKFVSPCTKYKTVMAEAMCNEGCKDSVAGVSLLQQIKSLVRPNHYCDMYEKVMIQSLDLGVGKAVETGLPLTDIAKLAQLVVGTIIDYLHGRKRMISKFEEIYQIGTEAAKGERKIGVLVAKAFEKVGNDGLCIVTEGKNPKIELEVMNVMTLNWRPVSPLFLAEWENAVVLENPLVLIFESKIWNKNVVEQAITTAGYRPLLIFVENLEDAAVGSILLDKSGLINKVHIFTRPEDHENWKDIMQDIAIFTGSQVVTGSYDFKNILQMLGSCKKVKVEVEREKRLVIHGGHGSQATIENRCEQLRSSINLSTSNYERTLLEERLKNIYCSAAIFKVGGACKLREKKSQVLEAVIAAKNAVEQGILPGAGVAFLHASKELDKFPTKNSDERIIIKLFQDALKMPVFTIASSLGFDGSFVVQKLLEEDNPDLGYDPLKGEYVDAVKLGVFDVAGTSMNTLVKMTVHFINHSLYNNTISKKEHEGT